jgi:hypothetical protein
VLLDDVGELARVRPRLPAAQLAQPLGSSNAFWAAATAASTSALPPRGAVAMTAPLAGFTTSNVWPSAASTDSPPMTIRRLLMAVEGVGSMAMRRNLGLGARRPEFGVAREGREDVGRSYAALWRRPATARAAVPQR